MVFCGNIGVKSYSDTKVYLKGTVTGLDTSKKYCLHYFDWGDKNLPNKTYSYTYIKNKTSFDLGSAGCYVPRSAWADGEQMEIRCNEIGANCEDITKNACGEVLLLEIVQDQYVYYVVEDDAGNKVSNARIECYGDVLYTGTDGRASHTLNEGKTYYATCYPPAGYECVDCYESFTVTGTTIIDFKLKRPEEPEPEPEPEEWCFVDIQVTDEDDDNLDCRVCVPGAEGPDCQQTGTDGVTTFQLRRRTLYTATASKTGYVDYNGFGSRSFTTPGGTSDFLALRLAREPTVCPDVDAKFTIHAPWQNDAQTEIKVNEEVVVEDASSSDGEIEDGEVDWGDGAVSQLDYGWWSAPGVKEVKHTYVVPGEYTIVYTAVNECESSDTQSFHITVLAEEEVECTISTVTSVDASDTFIATINCDPYQSFEVKIRSGLIHKIIGVGDTNSSGVAKISCVIDEPGQHRIYGYDKGGILPGGFVTNDVLINVRSVDIVDDRLTLVVPFGTIAGEIELSGIAPAGEIVEIVHDKKWAINPILTKVTADEDGTYTATITVEEFGAIEVYARIKKEGWLGIDFLEKDMVSETHTIWVITTPIILGLVAMLVLVADKKYGFIGIFKGR